MENVDMRQMKREMTREKRGQMDLPFAMLVVLISTIGLIMMFSASYASANQKLGIPTYYFLRQGGFMLAGFVVMYIISRLNYQTFRVLSVPLMAVALALMALVPFIGKEEGGATRWIFIGGVSVQPSEIAKIAIIVMFSTMITANQDRMKTFRHGVLPYGVILAVFAAMLVMQPHLSGTILILGVGAAMLFIGGVHLGWFAAGGALVGVGAWFAFTFMEHAKTRIALWQDPWIDPQGAGYQAIQSLLAIGSGGLFGKGLGKSVQKYLYLPEQHNDFVFAIVCEELGLIGAAVVLLLFAMLILRGYWIALHARDRFGTLLVTGITTLLALQTFLNVAVVTSLIPVTGISMPFFSYGGSSLLVMLGEMGIVLAVSRQIPAPKTE